MDVDRIISRHPDVMSGALVFTGTRVPVEALFGNLADGTPLDGFLANHPAVSREQAANAILLAGGRMISRTLQALSQKAE